MNNTETNNETRNIQSFMNFPCFDMVGGKAVTTQELREVQPLMAKQWDVLEETEEVIDYFYTCVTNVRFHAHRKANTHETGFNMGGDFLSRSYFERFVNEYRMGITLECEIPEASLTDAIEQAQMRDDSNELHYGNEGKLVKLTIRIPEDNLKEMYEINQTK